MRISVPLPGVLLDRDRAAEAFHDVLGDRQAEPGAAAFGREVGIENARQVGALDAGAAIGDRRMATPPSVETRRQATLCASSAPHRIARVHDQIDEGDAQALGVGANRRDRLIELHIDLGAGAGLRRRGRFAAQRIDVGRRQLEANRPREVEHVVHDPVQTNHLAVDVGGRLAHRGGADIRAAAACAAPP